MKKAHFYTRFILQLCLESKQRYIIFQRIAYLKSSIIFFLFPRHVKTVNIASYRSIKNYQSINLSIFKRNVVFEIVPYVKVVLFYSKFETLHFRMINRCCKFPTQEFYSYKTLIQLSDIHHQECFKNLESLKPLLILQSYIF